MCLAIAPAVLGIANFAVGAASAIAGYQSQVQQADQQNQYYMQNAEAANEAAMAAYHEQQIELNGKLGAADQDLMERRIAALKARGTAKEAAGSAGVTGLSVDALIDDFYGVEGRGADAVTTNFDLEKNNILAQMDATQHNTTARINSVQRAQAPSFLGAAIRIAGSALSGYSVGTGKSPSFNPLYNQALGIPG